MYLTEYETVKEYEHKFCSGKFNPVIFIISVTKTHNGHYVIKWILPECPTDIKVWTANLLDMRSTLKVIC